MLTKIEKELNSLMKSRDVTLDSRCGIMIELKTAKNYKTMLQWIKKNPQAGQYEIIGYVDEITGSGSTSSKILTKKTASSRAKKIAVF